jgi:hypothetical protein
MTSLILVAMLTAYSKVNSSLSFAVGRLCLFYP